MNPAKEPQKNWLLLNRFFFQKNIKYILILYVFLFSLLLKGQIANYVNNGSFEDKYNCLPSYLTSNCKFWNAIDSVALSTSGQYMSVCAGNVPVNAFGFQYPHSGNTYIRITPYCSTTTCTFYNSRYFPKNRLKNTLLNGHTYCVKMYVSLEEPSPKAIDALQILLADATVDTISYGSMPLTYLTPQISYSGSPISDTLNWTKIEGTFLATGNEKYLILGNFKTDIATAATAISTGTNTANWSEYWVDDVSVIDIDLPAYAGPDIFGIPNNTVYIGRPQDVGIDEACMWYKLPNATTAIDTAAGITRTVSLSIDTYVVRQEICGNVKWDTVVVYPSGVGLNEGEIIKNNISVFPNPARDVLNIEFNIEQEDSFKTILIYNALGELIREEEISFKNKNAIINTADLINGVYSLSLKGDESEYISKRFVISK